MEPLHHISSWLVSHLDMLYGGQLDCQHGLLGQAFLRSSDMGFGSYFPHSEQGIPRTYATQNLFRQAYPSTVCAEIAPNVNCP